MFNMGNSAYNFYKIRRTNLEYITSTAREGIKLLSKEVDNSLLNAYKNYVSSMLNLVSQNLNYNFMNSYIQKNISIATLHPKQQVQEIVEYLIQIGKQL